MSLKRLGYAFGLPVLLLALWWGMSVAVPSFFVPTPPQLVETLWEVWIVQGRVWSDLVPSLVRLVAGISISLVLGVTLGLLIGSIPWLRKTTEPLLELFRATPSLVLIPLFILLIGINDVMKIVVIVSGAIWPVILNTVEGVRAMDPVLRDTGKSYGIDGARRIAYFVLPAAGPRIMAGVRQCLSLGLILMVVSEMFGSSSGLGFTIVLFQRSFAIPEMWSGIAILGFIGIGLAVIFRFSERKILGWYHGQREVQRAG